MQPFTSASGLQSTPKPIIYKLVFLTLIIAVLWVPLTMIRGLLNERKRTEITAIQEISEGWGGQQTISPPLLRVATGSVHSVLLPDAVSARVSVETEHRKVGIFSTPVYVADVDIQGSFAFEDLVSFQSQSGIDLDSFVLEFLTSDIRGVARIHEFSLAGIAMKPSSTGTIFGRQGGLGRTLNSASMPTQGRDLMAAALRDRKALPFRLRFALKGHEQLSMLPLARDLTFTVSGKHPHPSFADGVLPNQRNVSKTGFSASWQVSEFNRHFAQINLRTTSSEHLDENALSMRLVQQGEIYQRNDRAGKYSFLFLGLSIACFFLIEVVLRLNLHPMHYLQLGLGLGLFYLLLLALSEHIGFNYAYLSAASATTLLMTGYCKAVMRSWLRASLAAGVIALMYGFLFLLLSRQQSSLLIGAIGLFVLLSIIMYMTRHLDWNRGDFGRVEQAA